MNNNNSNKVLYGIIGVVLLFFVLIAGAYLYQQNKDKTTNNQNDTSTSDTTSDDSQVSVTSFESEKGVAVTLTSPTRGGTVASPLSVAGMVPGSWSQEGQFTLRLLDADSNVLTEGAAKLDGDWMTENQVLFTATLTFENAPAVGSSGILILEKANPSGMEENADSVSVPILF